MNASLPQDPLLPQLATALDGAAMAQVFAAALQGPALLACEVDRVKYRPGRSCSVSYRLRLCEAPRGEFEQRVSARFLMGGEARRRFEQAGARGGSKPSPAGPALQHEAALDMLAWWLPNDPKLAALALLCDDAELRRRCLGEVVALLTGGRGRLVEHRTTLVQVVPELRVCARVDLTLQDEAGAPTQQRTLYVKADAERSGAHTRAVMQALSDSPAQSSGLLCTPRSLLWQAEAGLHWISALPGQPLLEVDPQIRAASSMRVARQLALLHATPVPAGPRLLDLAALRAQRERAAALLAQVQPAWQPLLERLCAALQAGEGLLAGLPPSTLHGDLHPNNILVDARHGSCRQAFIDLDDVQQGPAVLEVGGWIADAHYRAIVDGHAPAAASAAADLFLAAYVQTAGQALEPAALAWAAAHHLLCRRACGGVANLKPGRYAAVPALLEVAAAIACAGSVDAALDTAGEAA
ncbi:Phosphotransferase family protein [Rubrivivax sp. A210]|uniref:phosphotransferase n=1 Tax=Rubrivivax sp. A210 TaxID=2772301 RepID=UPI0019185F32|nr:aminoglycoside phosphotransferase family protein [Rubrivivax sp. A210]CAD5373920.1 Phosphotransferase family protein [Rubrivivax sp. A210]